MFFTSGGFLIPVLPLLHARSGGENRRIKNYAQFVLDQNELVSNRSFFKKLIRNELIIQDRSKEFFCKCDRTGIGPNEIDFL